MSRRTDVLGDVVTFCVNHDLGQAEVFNLYHDLLISFGYAGQPGYPPDAEEVEEMQKEIAEEWKVETVRFKHRAESCPEKLEHDPDKNRIGEIAQVKVTRDMVSIQVAIDTKRLAYLLETVNPLPMLEVVNQDPDERIKP